MGTRKRSDVPEQIPSPLSLALTYLRTSAGWSRAQLARTLGLADESLISAYERGAKPLTREKLDSLVESLGHPPEAVDVLLFVHGLIYPEPREEAPEERRTMDRAAMAAGWTAGRIAAEAVRAELIRKRKQETAEAAKRQAEERFRSLIALTPRERRGLVEVFPDYWSRALAVRVCQASVKKAAHKPGEALELAELALWIAERIPGDERERSRLRGYCWGHIANARRVANDHAGSDEAFARAWELWHAGADSDPELLGEWVLPSMEASLRRDQRRFSEALALLDRAKASQGGSSPVALIFLLLQKEHIFEQLGDTQNALAALAEAAPFVEASGDARQLFLFRFKSANHLYHLERYEEAAKLLPRVREMALQQGNEMDLLRLVWLSAKVAAGQGRTEEAIAGLEQVSRDFTDRELPYDAALSSLDLSVLWLTTGRTAQVRELAVAMGRIFKANGVDREALVALKLFCDAASQESATVELARRTIAKVEQVRRSASPPDKGRSRA
jgi:transcriptional regulator with XRE-family HTH domain